MERPILTLAIEHEEDVAAARRRAQQAARALSFDSLAQARIATAVSEIARNALNYAGGGRIEFWVDGHTAPQSMQIIVSDRGPGIKHLDQILQGQYHSTTGMGLGILGARRLLDEVLIDSSSQGTIVRLRQSLPKRASLITTEKLKEIIGLLAAERPDTPLEQIRQQNQELLEALSELQQSRDKLLSLNRELEDTNRGVVALTAQLDEQNERLKVADETKSRFLSHMSHEFRTPLNSILALSRLLLDRADGDLTQEQERQVTFIRKGGTELLEMVNELLDLAKIEAGKTEIFPAEFSVENLFSALRGVFRPLLLNRDLSLVFEDAGHLPSPWTDEGKVSQILRNFISNALKFTERGEVRVSAVFDPALRMMIFSVKDTGIGVPPADQKRVFEEFAQVENPLQRRSKGTGLGLSLCRKLATLLGGDVSLESVPGVGSTFSARIPLRYPGGEGRTQRTSMTSDEARGKILVIDDDDSFRYVVRKMLEGTRFEVDDIDRGAEGVKRARQSAPHLILLDLEMPGLDGAGTLAQLKEDPLTSAIPVVMITSHILTSPEREKLLQTAHEILSKNDLKRERLLDAVERWIKAFVEKAPNATETTASLESKDD